MRSRFEDGDLCDADDLGSNCYDGFVGCMRAYKAFIRRQLCAKDSTYSRTNFAALVKT
jgi:hypothetical protein